MQINNQATGINLKNLFFHLLYRWRSILIIALIGAIALCGYQYLSIKKVHDAGEQTKEERQYQINLQQYKEELASNRNTVRVYTKLLQDKNNYLNESTYIQLSPQNVWVASNKYLVKPDQSVMDKLPQGSSIDPADSILPAYAAPLSEITDENVLKEAFGSDNADYINELVVMNTYTGDNTITVYVLGESKEDAQAGLALLHEQMEKLANEKAQDIARHQLILVSEKVTRGIDKQLAEKIDLEKKQEDLSKSIEANQKTLQEARLKLDRLEADGEPSAPSQHLVRMAVIGFILGAALLTFIYAVSYALGGVLNNSSDLSGRYSLPIFGEFATAGLLHSSKGLDKLFSKWELGEDALDHETVYDNIAALIAEKHGTENILLVSTLAADKLTAIKDALAKRLPEKTIDEQGELVRNSSAISEASKADAVIVVEAKRISKIKDIDLMAEKLTISGAKVIGAVVL